MVGRSVTLRPMAKILPELVEHDGNPESGTYRKRAEAPDHAPINQPVIAKALRGARYEQFVDDGWAEKVAYGEISLRQAAKDSGISPQALTGYIAAYVEDQRKEDSKRFWEISAGANQEVRLDLDMKIENLNKLAKAFKLFRENNFRTRENTAYLTADFHLHWIIEIMRAIITGGRLTILSPPRHGKTDLLVHFIIWLLIRNPNLRILWVGGNKDIAELSVDQARQEFEDNEGLRAKFLPPGHTFQPQTRSAKWRSSEFVIATRTLTLRAPSVIAVGRRGKLLSRDTDIIFTDDLEDADSTAQEGELEKTRRWFVQNLGSRKEAHTAWINIGSRQAINDLHGKLLENPGWSHIVERAHDDRVCDKEMHGPDHTFIPEDHPPDCALCAAHDKHGCVLFPEVRNMWYLMEQYKTSEPEHPGFFEMNMNNNPHDAGHRDFTREIVDACKEPDLVMGVRCLELIPKVDPEGRSFTHLVAGMDPSYSGYQASFLWAFNVFSRRRVAVDIENRKGGGIPAAKEIIAKWFELYDLRHWVIETNLYKKGIIEDRELVNFCSERGISLESWETYTNKWDPVLGVTSLADRMKAGEIIIPTGDQQSMAKFNEYRKQLLSFNQDSAKNRRTPLDIVMSSWFPESVFRRLLKDSQSETIIEYEQMYYPDELFGDTYQSLMG